ncbi:MAG TPA: PPOX class F420-dependent oxidoreductase [Solirubrobacteraceae bacterium]|nr:PPOX class F420-dependent oxidoreductase [Solirubrobacteraceae bacterium]
MAELDDDIRAFFRAPNLMHVATILPDGAPHSVPVWCRLEEGRIAFFTQPGSRKARNLARDPRLAISAVMHDNPYAMVQIRGRVAETLEGDAALEVIDRLSDDYTGEPFGMRSGIVYLVEPGRVQSMILPFQGRRD